MNFFGWFRRRRPQARERVVVTEDEIIRTRPDGATETVRWEDLTEVGIITTDEGPFVEDVFWILVGADERTGCAVAQGAEGNEELLARLQKLPGFDNEAVIQAMGSTTNARFTCWQRPGSLLGNE